MTQPPVFAPLIVTGLIISTGAFLFLLPLLTLSFWYAIELYHSADKEYYYLFVLEALPYIAFVLLWVYSLLTNWVLLIQYVRTDFTQLPSHFLLSGLAISIILSGLLFIGYTSSSFRASHILFPAAHGVAGGILAILLWHNFNRQQHD